MIIRGGLAFRAVLVLSLALPVGLVGEPASAFLDKVIRDIDKAAEGAGKDLDKLFGGSKSEEPATKPAPQPAPPATTPAPATTAAPAAAPVPDNLNRDRAAVLQAQQELQRLGYDVGTPDGLYGNRTRTAIVAFEKARGLTSTGDVTRQLLTSLAAAQPDGSKPAAVAGAASTAPASGAPAAASTPSQVAPPAEPSAGAWYVLDGPMFQLRRLREIQGSLTEAQVDAFSKQVFDDNASTRRHNSGVYKRYPERNYYTQEQLNRDPKFVVIEVRDRSREALARLASYVPAGNVVMFASYDGVYDLDRQELRLTFPLRKVIRRKGSSEVLVYHHIGTHVLSSDDVEGFKGVTSDMTPLDRELYRSFDNMMASTRFYPGGAVFKYESLDVTLPLPLAQAEAYLKRVAGGNAEFKNWAVIYLDRVPEILNARQERVHVPADGVPLVLTDFRIDLLAKDKREVIASVDSRNLTPLPATDEPVAAAPAQSPSPAPASAEHTLEPFGPDLLGMRLGMTRDQIEALIQEHYAGTPLVAFRSRDDVMLAKDAFVEMPLGPTYVYRPLNYTDGPSYEAIAYATETVEGRETVIAIQRYVNFDEPINFPSLIPDLQAKYGNPSPFDGSSVAAVLFATPPGSYSLPSKCFLDPRYYPFSRTGRQAYQEKPSPAFHLQPRATLAHNVTPDSVRKADYSDCPTGLIVQGGGSEDASKSLNFTLTDKAFEQYVLKRRLQEFEQQVKAAKAKAKPTIKF